MIIVFDTNVYRSWYGHPNLTPEAVKEKVAELTELEKRKGITPLMSSTVAMELLSHLQDESSTNYRSCLLASQAIYYHTGNEKEFRLLPLPEVQIAKEYFNQQYIEAENTQNAIGQILYNIACNPTEDTVRDNINSIRQITEFLSTAEDSLADEVDSLIVNKVTPEQYKNWISSDHFKICTAQAMLCAVYMRMNGVTKEQAMKKVSDSMIKRYIKSHPVALQFRSHFWSCFLNEGFDLRKKKRANSIWDEFIMACAGRSINDEPIRIVTREKNIHKAAEEVSCSDFFMTPEQYKKYLDSE